MSKRFTVAEAQSLVPRLESSMRTAVTVKPEFDEAESSMRGFLDRVNMMGGMMVDREQVRAARHRRDELAQRLKTAIEEIQDLGCVVKDLDIGLVDFPSLFRGVEVCLCWKLGESKIAWWHGLEEGFRGRKPIDEDFLRNHRGDPPQ